jgi:hypothetical protein
MPFKSQAQKGWMYSNHPEMARQWKSETPKGKKLPKKVGTKNGKSKTR